MRYIALIAAERVDQATRVDAEAKVREALETLKETNIQVDGEWSSVGDEKQLEEEVVRSEKLVEMARKVGGLFENLYVVVVTCEKIQIWEYREASIFYIAIIKIPSEKMRALGE